MIYRSDECSRIPVDQRIIRSAFLALLERSPEVFNFPRFVLLSNRRCFEPFVGFVALRFLRGMATL